MGLQFHQPVPQYLRTWPLPPLRAGAVSHSTRSLPMPPKATQLKPPFEATPKQLELAHAWHDPSTRVVTIGGAIRSGKTQAAGRLLVETAIEQPSVYLVSRLTYRQLRATPQAALPPGRRA